MAIAGTSSSTTTASDNMSQENESSNNNVLAQCENFYFLLAQYQHICITRWGQYRDEFDFWNRSSETCESSSKPLSMALQSLSHALISRAQQVILSLSL
ncbi:uncharacterized protein LOC133039461 isoform X2 [Cannabis sativa]|uniref:uncharacterized protein LOC133039461 isoform X2 n=1 Tax=Cannabis sativa TaxID=3483 RepID=UPI0029CA8020|nr:uncharacterized protein LOC133039461 isoform X2 [Cannabis sativa]